MGTCPLRIIREPSHCAGIRWPQTADILMANKATVKLACLIGVEKFYINERKNTSYDKKIFEVSRSSSSFTSGSRLECQDTSWFGVDDESLGCGLFGVRDEVRRATHCA